MKIQIQDFFRILVFARYAVISFFGCANTQVPIVIHINAAIAKYALISLNLSITHFTEPFHMQRAE